MSLAPLLVSITLYYSNSLSSILRAQSSGDSTHLPSILPAPSSSVGSWVKNTVLYFLGVLKPRSRLLLLIPSLPPLNDLPSPLKQIHSLLLVFHVYSRRFSMYCSKTSSEFNTVPTSIKHLIVHSWLAISTWRVGSRPCTCSSSECHRVRQGTLATLQSVSSQMVSIALPS